jgi:hypothetical protein
MVSYGTETPNRKLFPDHLSFILCGALVVAGSIYIPNFGGNPFLLRIP